MGKLNRPKVYGVIYKIENKINGKIYIGQSIKSLKKRMEIHFKSRSYIGNSLRKHGLESFEISEIEKLYSKESLNERECFWIAFFNCKSPNGYNLTNGGKGIVGYIAASYDQFNFEAKLCECGCPGFAKPGNRFILGHGKEGKAHYGADNFKYKDGSSIKRHEWSQNVLERDNYTCQQCFKTKKEVRLHTHHIKDKKDFPELIFDVDNGITLCVGCHASVHRKNTTASAETKQRMSKKRKGVPKPELQGKPTWNKGLKGVQEAWNKGMKGWNGESKAEWESKQIKQKMEDDKNEKYN